VTDPLGKIELHKTHNVIGLDELIKETLSDVEAGNF